MTPEEQLVTLQRQLAGMQQQLAEMQQQLAATLQQLVTATPPASTSSPATAQPAPAAPVESTPPAPRQPSASASAGDQVPAAPAAPLHIKSTADSAAQPGLVPNGISATTGQPLLVIDVAATTDMLKYDPDNPLSPGSHRLLHRAKQSQFKEHLGPVFGVNEDRLDECRWAVVVNADDDVQLLRALTPLITYRSQQQDIKLPELAFREGERCGEWMARFLTGYPPESTEEWAVRRKNEWQKLPPVLIYRPGETCTEWLSRHFVSQGPVDPHKRLLPFYLMLAGRPGPVYNGDTTFIPFEFQYELDMFWGVGRLCFTDTTGQHQLDAYTAYAEQAVAFEQAEGNPPYQKQAVFFGTRHDLDPATTQSMQQLLKPLTDETSGIVRTWGFQQQLLLEANATRANLDRVLRGQVENGRPALLFTATHGIGFDNPDDARLPMHQGALLCQDWSGFGSMKREHWYAGEDLTEQTSVQGLVVVCFACFGAGCPHEDQFVFDESSRRPRIAPYPLVAQLPQQLLQRGTLAVLGHVERAWNYSFSEAGVLNQTQAFEDLLGRIMAGKRMGFATDQFNMRQGVLSSRLADEIEKAKYGKVIEPTNFNMLWMARNDARNYMLLGDPAVRLPWR